MAQIGIALFLMIGVIRIAQQLGLIDLSKWVQKIRSSKPIKDFLRRNKGE